MRVHDELRMKADNQSKKNVGQREREGEGELMMS